MEIIRETRLEGVLPERISFNYEELKNELDERLKVYQGKEKTDASNYKERKADRARLNDLARSLNDDRKQLKQQLLSPLTNGTPEHISYSDQIDQLIGSIKMVVGEIDAGIKEYEDGLREAKRTDIIAFFKSHWIDAFVTSGECAFDSIKNSAHWQNFAEEQMNRKRNAWLNATCDDEFIRGEIRNEVTRCVQAYKLLDAQYKDEDEVTRIKAFDALAVSFDTAYAMSVVQAHKEQIAKVEQKKKEQAKQEEQKMAAKVSLSEPVGTTGAKPVLYSCTMKFVGSAQAFKDLKEYLEMNNNITYEVVEHMVEIENK